MAVGWEEPAEDTELDNLLKPADIPHSAEHVTFSVMGPICVHVPMSPRARTAAPDCVV